MFSITAFQCKVCLPFSRESLESLPKHSVLPFVSFGFDTICFFEPIKGMSPCEMARRLDVGAVGTFETLSDKYSTFAQLDECNTNLKLRCLWHHWDMKRNSTRTRLLKTAKALDEISSTLPFANTSILQRLETGIWSAVSDFLYLPKQAFPVYAAFVTGHQRRGGTWRRRGRRDVRNLPVLENCRECFKKKVWSYCVFTHRFGSLNQESSSRETRPKPSKRTRFFTRWPRRPC